MAAVALRVGAFHELHPLTPQTASGATAIDIEIQPDASCFFDLDVQKPAAAVCSVVLKRQNGAEIPLFPSSESVGKTSIQALDVLLGHGDELRVDIDTTSGAKTVSGVARRF